jgi:hypothetical protein
MTKIQDPNLIGKKFGKLTVVEIINTYFNGKLRRKPKCLCECGNYSYPTVNKLSSGETLSCGCLRKEKWRKAYYAWTAQQNIK